MAVGFITLPVLQTVGLIIAAVSMIGIAVTGGRKKKGFIFPHRLDPKRHRTRQAVFKDIKKQAEVLGLHPQISPHTFRKVYAVKLYHRTKDLATVQRILGHKKMETTLIYALADVIK